MRGAELRPHARTGDDGRERDDQHPHDEPHLGPPELHSLRAHHLLPFTGVARVAYLPGDRIIGLSKLARVVELSLATFRTRNASRSRSAMVLSALPSRMALTWGRRSNRAASSRTTRRRWLGRRPGR